MASKSEISRVQLLIASALLPAQIFIFNVTTIVAGNQQYLSTSLGMLLSVSVLAFLIIFAGIYGISGALEASDRRIMGLHVLPAAFLIVWMQSQLLVWDYGGLTGGSIDWGSYSWQGYVDAALWLGAITIVVLLRKRIGAGLLQMAGVIAGLQLVLTLYSGSTHLIADSNARAQTQGLESINQFSTQGNVIQLVIDGFQSDILEELLQHDSLKSKYDQGFRGFTFFRENMSVFPYTQFSVPTYLAAKVYQNKQQKEEFIDSKLSAETIAATAKDEGYRVELAVNGPYFTQRHAVLPHDSIMDIDEVALGDSLLRDLTLVWDMSLFRSMPQLLKPLIYNDQKWLLSRLAVDDVREGYSYFRHTDFLNELSASMRAKDSAPVYKLVHVKQTHRPMVVNPQCEFAGGTLPDTRTTLAVQTACTLNTVISLFDRLRQLGLYDRSLIVMHADHGGWVPTLRDGRHVPMGDGEAPDFAASLASALLMVKPPGATGPLETSDVLTSLIDIPDTISSVMNWDADFGQDSVFALDDNETRPRKYMFYFWHRDEWTNDFTQPIVEYTIEGSHFETTWKETAVHPPAEGLKLN